MSVQCLAAARARVRLERPELQPLEDECLNAQARPEQLGDFLTPKEFFFVRNNGTLPEEPSDPKAWRFSIEGEVREALSFTIADLLDRFEYHEVIAVLECAGNARSFFEPRTSGLQWGLGAVGCARWGGVRLRDVLHAAGLRSTAIYTGHISPDLKLGTQEPAISRGIPIDKALAPETLLAFRMNDEALPFLNGGPLRIVVPGFPGSAWQKWLTGILVRDREHDGPKMLGTDYRMPRIPVRPGDAINPEDFEIITDVLPRAILTSLIRAPHGLSLTGKAWAGASGLAIVEYSLDDGATWFDCDLDTETEHFAWRSFRFTIQDAKVRFVLLRASDRAGRTQPVGTAPWNPRGYCNNGAQTIDIESLSA